MLRQDQHDDNGGKLKLLSGATTTAELVALISVVFYVIILGGKSYSSNHNYSGNNHDGTRLKKNLLPCINGQQVINNIILAAIKIVPQCTPPRQHINNTIIPRRRRAF